MPAISLRSPSRQLDVISSTGPRPVSGRSHADTITSDVDKSSDSAQSDADASKCLAAELRRIAKLPYCTVYALTDPRPQVVRYVGCTRGPLRDRVRDHLSPNATPRVREWVRDLQMLGLTPGVVELETVLNANPYRHFGYHAEREAWWINFYASPWLVNVRHNPLCADLEFTADVS